MIVRKIREMGGRVREEHQREEQCLGRRERMEEEDKEGTGGMIGRSNSQRLRNHRLQTLPGWGQGSHCPSQMVGSRTGGGVLVGGCLW